MVLGILIVIGALCVSSLEAGVPVSSCQDLDTQACQLFKVAKPDLCTDPAFSQSTCRRYCGNCPLECYSCPTSVLDPKACANTSACSAGSTCMTKHLQAIDGHHEYIMSCELKGICEGLTFGFGKRDISDFADVEEHDRYQRDVFLSCCDTDFCNFPFLTTTTMAPTTTTANIAACHRDIVFLVDDSGSVGSTNFRHSLDFIRSIVNQINVGPNNAQVAVMAYSTHPQIEWYLNKYHTKTDVLNHISRIPYQSGITRTGDALEAVRTNMLTVTHGDRLNAENAVIEWYLNRFHTKNDVISHISQIPYKSGITRTGDALEAVRTDMLTVTHGDRLDAENAVVVLTDGRSNDKTDTIHEANNLHAVSKDVVSIVVGRGVDQAELNAIATDGHHVFDIHAFSNLTLITQQVLNLICG